MLVSCLFTHKVHISAAGGYLFLSLDRLHTGEPSVHILKETDLAREYQEGRIRVLSEDEYIEVLKRCVPLIPAYVVVHRLTGDGDKKLLIAPMWSTDKKHVLTLIRKEVLNG